MISPETASYIKVNWKSPRRDYKIVIHDKAWIILFMYVILQHALVPPTVKLA